jgi:WD40 repeat protein
MPLGTASLQILFYSQPGGGGDLVGSAGALVEVLSNGFLGKPGGAELGSVNFSARASKVVVTPDQAVLVGETKDLTLRVEDSTGSPIVVTPGSNRFEIVEGGGFLTLALGGAARGVASGVAKVKATVDGVVSEAAEVRVRGSAPAVTRLPVAANDLAFDSVRNRLLAPINQVDAPIQTIDLSSRTLGATISLPATGLQVAASSDGSRIFAGLTDGTIRILDGPAGTILNTISLEGGDVANEILAIPSTASGFVAGLVDGATKRIDRGIRAYDAEVRRADTILAGHSLAINPAGNRVFGYEQFNGTNPGYTIARLNSSGLLNIITVRDQMTGQENRIHWSGGFVVADGGEVLDVGNGERRRRLALGAGPFRGTDYSSQTLTAGISASPHAIQIFDPATGEKKHEFPLSGTPDTVLQVISCGPGRIAWRTATEVVIAVDLP